MGASGFSVGSPGHGVARGRAILRSARRLASEGDRWKRRRAVAKAGRRPPSRYGLDSSVTCMIMEMDRRPGGPGRTLVDLSFRERYLGPSGPR